MTPRLVMADVLQPSLRRSSSAAGPAFGYEVDNPVRSEMTLRHRPA